MLLKNGHSKKISITNISIIEFHVDVNLVDGFILNIPEFKNWRKSMRLGMILRDLQRLFAWLRCNSAFTRGCANAIFSPSPLIQLL